jgi:SAM-dependent methyltransferase
MTATTGLLASDQTVFLHSWRTYRKVLDNNYMFHRQVYDCLRQIILDRARRPYRFLDVACGDASASVRALIGTPIEHYYGVDISRPALEIAHRELLTLSCPVTLEQSDFVAALANWTTPLDVVWVGQSLHHLGTAAKLRFMKHVRRALNDNGLFLIWEPTLLDDEVEEGWISRFERSSRSRWSSLTDEEWSAMLSHVRAADHPETADAWRKLGIEAGFQKAAQIYVGPTQLARVYCYDGRDDVGRSEGSVA